MESNVHASASDDQSQNMTSIPREYNFTDFNCVILSICHQMLLRVRIWHLYFHLVLTLALALVFPSVFLFLSKIERSDKFRMHLVVQLLFHKSQII